LARTKLGRQVVESYPAGSKVRNDLPAAPDAGRQKRSNGLPLPWEGEAPSEPRTAVRPRGPGSLSLGGRGKVLVPRANRPRECQPPRPCPGHVSSTRRARSRASPTTYYDTTHLILIPARSELLQLLRNLREIHFFPPPSFRPSLTSTHQPGWIVGRGSRPASPRTLIGRRSPCLGPTLSVQTNPIQVKGILAKNEEAEGRYQIDVTVCSPALFGAYLNSRFSACPASGVGIACRGCHRPQYDVSVFPALAPEGRRSWGQRAARGAAVSAWWSS